MSLKLPRLQIILDLVFLILVTAIATYFRFYNLSHNPGLYNDEGTLLNIAINLFHGRMEYLGIQGSWLLAGRMPIFPWLLSLSYHYFEPSLLVLRIFTTTSGVFSVILLFLFLRSISDTRLQYLKYLSPLILALHPKFVLFNRIGFGYNLLIPITIIVIWLFWLYLESKQDRWLILASITTGVGSLIELAYISFLISLVLFVFIVNPKKAPLVILLSFTPLLMYFIVSYWLYGDAFLFDWQVTFERGTSFPIVHQIAHIILNFIFFVVENSFVLIGIFGIMSLPNRKLGGLLFFCILLPFLITTRTFSTLRHSFYYFLAYTPLIAIGISNFVYQISKWVSIFTSDLITLSLQKKLSNELIRPLRIIFFFFLIFFTLIAPMFFLIINLNQEIKQSFRTSFDNLLINVSEFNIIFNYIQKTVNSTDLIIASPAIAWAFPSNVTDYQISIAVNESPTIHFPSGIPEERMRFESSLEIAKYVVVDSIMRSWQDSQIPGIESWIRKIEATWLPVAKTKSIVIYRNPSR